MLSPVVQWIIVGIAVAAAVFFIARLLRRRDQGCGSCPLKDNCGRKK